MFDDQSPAGPYTYFGCAAYTIVPTEFVHGPAGQKNAQIEPGQRTCYLLFLFSLLARLKYTKNKLVNGRVRSLHYTSIYPLGLNLVLSCFPLLAKAAGR